MPNDRKLWVSLVLVVSGTFMILGFFGREIYRQAPPIPDRVVDESGAELFTSEDILDGQQVWQSIGGQQVGSVWGHGAYQAPDWSADWLHREALAMRENWSVEEHGAAFEELDADTQGLLSARLEREMRTNRFDEASGTLVITNARRVAMNETAQHYSMLFGGDDHLSSLREDYALHDDAVTDPERLEALNAFFFWTSWACVTERPGESFTYTNNWPHEPLVGNQPTAANIVWSMLSIVLLLAGAAGLVWFHESRRREEPENDVPKRDPLGGMQLTPSMRAVHEVSGRRDRALRRASVARRVDGALHGRRRLLLRDPAARVLAVRDHAHLAHPDRHLLDRNGLPGYRLVHRPVDRRTRNRASSAWA